MGETLKIFGRSQVKRIYADVRTGLTTIGGMFVAYSSKIDEIHHTHGVNTAIFH